MVNRQPNAGGDSQQMKRSMRRVDDLPVSGIFRLEDVFPHALRHGMLMFLGVLLLLTFILCLIIATLLFLPGFDISFKPLAGFLTEGMLEFILRKAAGVFFLLFSFWIFVYFLETYYRSLYFHNREYKAQKTGRRDRPVSEVIEMFYDSKDGDVLGTFLTSSIGRAVMLRLGASNDVKDFLQSRTDRRTVSFFETKEAGVITRGELGDYLFNKYPEFADFLFRHNISKEHFLGALAWMVKTDIFIKFQERWWSKWRLRKIPAFGKELAYGGAYVLDRYGSDVISATGAETTADYQKRRAKYVERMEATLAKESEANVLLVGDNGVGKMDLVRDLSRRVVTGMVPKQLVAHRLVELRTDLLISAMKTKVEFEMEFTRVLADANKAGNVILVFTDFPGFLKSAEGIGTDALRFLGKFLTNSEMKIIALSGNDSYHQSLETNAFVSNNFNVLKVEEPGFSSVVSVLEDSVFGLEHEYGVFFTYPALVEVARSAEYYITEGVMPDKALDLLVEVAPYAAGRGNAFITPEVVQDYVSEKTHIPMGAIDEEEKEHLENLEERLHALVVGQEKAINALSDTLRRARTGLRDPERPIGSFLFLGPTGVGKTQTAKAVAEVFFGDREAMSRIDMSEYSDAQALHRLTGSFSTGQVGTLTKLVKTRPYGVLLLDELEKSDRSVHDLLLQVLDEGYYSDMDGKKVNVRNIIFIATSNAGSDMIWQAAQTGRDTSQMKDELVSHIIETGIYRPEFLNRFDDVVVFHPLSRENLQEIAEIMLRGTKERIKQKGYELVVNEPLISYVMQVGYDPTFGARPMERAIKDTVEQVIAKKIISGALNVGDRVELTQQDLQGA